jgi:hypothetical protein
MPTLTEHDKMLVERAFMLGPSALYDEGFTTQSIGAFFLRAEIQEEWTRISREFTHQETLAATTRFGMFREMSKFAQGAVATFGRGLVGPQYLRDPKTNVIQVDARGNPMMIDPGITPIQLRCAEAVVDRLGLESGTKHDAHVSGMAPDTLFKSISDADTRLEEDPELKTDEQRSLSRERIRNVIAQFAGVVP